MRLVLLIGKRLGGADTAVTVGLLTAAVAISPPHHVGVVLALVMGLAILLIAAALGFMRWAGMPHGIPECVEPWWRAVAAISLTGVVASIVGELAAAIA